VYIPKIIAEAAGSKPFDELRQKCYENSGKWLPFNLDEYSDLEDYANKLIKLSGVNWNFEIKENLNPHSLELKLYKE